MPPIDPRKLKISELARLLNSTPLGSVIATHTLYRQRDLAGYMIGDKNGIDLLRYAGWLVWQRHTAQTENDSKPLTGYEARKERERARQAALSESGRNIGELPPIENPERKARGERDFTFFCREYFPEIFTLPFSDDHHKVISKIESAVLQGGLFALAMPRGSGKSSITETACLWAILYGHRPFVVLIGSDEKHAADMLDSIKIELEINDLLLADFPEAVFPIRCLEGIAQRANGQLYNGEQTRIGWTAKVIVLPTVEGSKASGAIIKVAGITGGIRGMKHKRADGKVARPTLVILDDPQTDESARSVSQCQERESIVAGAVLGMAGPGQKISAIMPCTVICKGDMADSILDREKHPDWQGERTKMVYSFPTNTKLWDEYGKQRADGLRSGDGGQSATQFYIANREAMDVGSRVAWPEQYDYDEVSAIQHAMNLKFRDEAAFYAEYQNEPKADDEPDDRLTADKIAEKINGRVRYSIPTKCNKLTMFIDVQGKVLYYAVMAFEDNFTGYVIDYGSYPDQKLHYYTLRDVKHTLFGAHPGTGQEGAWRAGFESLCRLMLDREWVRDDQTLLRISRCLIDANDGNAMDVVYEFCRSCSWPTVVMPSRGKGVGASNIPFSDYRKIPGDRVGHNWRVPASGGRGSAAGRSGAIRYLLMDTNFWKSFCRSRWLVALGDTSCFSVFGKNPVGHRMFAEQVAAEYSVRTQGRGRVVDEWKSMPGRDNHFLDCIVGCAVAASEQGICLTGIEQSMRISRGTVKLSELQKKKRKERYEQRIG